jgi:hypothetical protein
MCGHARRDGTVHSVTTSEHISRAEAALCLLAELALHHEEAFHEHLPVVLLICVIKADASVALVYEHSERVCPRAAHICESFLNAFQACHRLNAQRSLIDCPHSSFFRYPAYFLDVLSQLFLISYQPVFTVMQLGLFADGIWP